MSRSTNEQQRGLVVGFVVYLSFLQLAWSYKPHLQFNQNILGKASEVLQRNRGPVQGDPRPSEHLDTLAEDIIRDILELTGVDPSDQVETPDLLWAAVVWPAGIRQEFDGAISFGPLQYISQKKLTAQEGVLPYDHCNPQRNPTPMDPEGLGIPCKAGNTIYATAQAADGQLLHGLIFYQTYSWKVLGYNGEDFRSTKFKEVIKACCEAEPRILNIDSHEPINLTRLALCVHQEGSDWLISKYHIALRGMAVILSYSAVEGNPSFGLFTPAGHLLMEHVHVTVKLEGPLLFGTRLPLKEPIPQRTVALTFISAFGLRSQG